MVTRTELGRHALEGLVEDVLLCPGITGVIVSRQRLAILTFACNERYLFGTLPFVGTLSLVRFLLARLAVDIFGALGQCPLSPIDRRSAGLSLSFDFSLGSGS